jgi:16S rRNA (guanine1516-N2)-methyltransferase
MNSVKYAIVHYKEVESAREKDLQLRTKLPIIRYSDLSESHTDGYLYYLEDRLSFQLTNKKYKGPLSVSFKDLERRATDSLFRQNLIRALGLTKGRRPQVLDATAGFGSDSFLIAAAGSDVVLFERNAIVYELLRDGLMRYAALGAKENEKIKRMRLFKKDFLDTVAGQFSPEVVYLDPMFPRSKKNTLSKKPLNYLQKLLIEENDESRMLAMALEIATRRVVVKRGSHSAALGAGNIDFVFKGNSNRFDVYLT